MQNIAAENRLSETAFVLPREDGSFSIRYFAPGGEVGLCGHATLGSAFVLAHFVALDRDVIRFHTREETVSALRLPGDRIQLDFPAWIPRETPLTKELLTALNGIRPLQVLETRDLVCVMDSVERIRTFQPNLEAIAALPKRYLGLLLTARGENCDFVCRTFFPNIAIPEDPVCGSAQCTLIPLWARELQRETLTIHQLSPRTGVLYGEMAGNRVKISGNAALYLTGELSVREEV